MSEKILETFKGKVDKIEGEVAYVTIMDSQGRVSHAEMDALSLAASGIGGQDRFRCEVADRGSETALTMTKVPRRRITDEELVRIREKLDQALPDEILNPDGL